MQPKTKQNGKAKTVNNKFTELTFLGDLNVLSYLVAATNWANQIEHSQYDGRYHIWPGAYLGGAMPPPQESKFYFTYHAYRNEPEKSLRTTINFPIKQSLAPSWTISK